FGAASPAAVAAAQAYLLNRVQREFIAVRQGARRLQTVPTEYLGVDDSPYKAALARQLDPSVIVQWTGPAIVSATITPTQAAAAKQVYRHDIVVWDNYPVNDYTRNHLLLGPYTGRPGGLSETLDGIVANPMLEPRASDIALFTEADYTWNGAAYLPRRSWGA